MSRIFGSVDTEEVRELKVVQLEQRIGHNEETLKQVDEDLKYVRLLQLLYRFKFESTLINRPQIS